MFDQPITRIEAMDLIAQATREILDFMHVIKNYKNLDEASEGRLQYLLDEHYCRCKDLVR